MARWELMQPHYLVVPGTKWQHEETSRETGETARTDHPVPKYLDAGKIVCQGHGQRGDITFEGQPTPDMNPLDDEAEAISAKFKDQWIHPIESLSANDGNFGASLIAMFEKQMAQVAKQGAVAAPGVSQEAFDKLMAQVEALAAQNAELQAKLETKEPALRRA